MNRDELRRTAARKMSINAAVVLLMIVVMNWSVHLHFKAAYTINTIAAMVLILASVVGVSWPIYLNLRYASEKSKTP